MNVLTKAKLLIDVARWRLSWPMQNTKYATLVPGNPKFMGPRDAVRHMIKDGDVIAFSGLGGNQRVSIMLYAMRDLFKEEGHPRDLTLLCIGGTGARGQAPGTLEDVAVPGLATRFIGGHVETFKALLRLADAGQIELQVIPQGLMALLLASQATGETLPPIHTGVGTFVDPRVGFGTNLTDPDGEQFVEVVGSDLQYTIPPVDVAIFNAPAADREGNIYVKNCAIIAESKEIAACARRNGGKVIVNVGLIVDEGYDDIFMPAHEVDAIVQWRRTEQIAGMPHYRHYPMFTTHSDTPVKSGVDQVRWINSFVGITPRRKPIDLALARLAASVFVDHVQPGAWVNVGVGLPEEVSYLLLTSGITEKITLFTESGVVGGIPAPGVFFGTAVSPEKIISSAEVFHEVYERLDVTIVGVLEADSAGNVNVSKRGEGFINYVGPGGFIDLTTAAKTVLFVSSWMAKGRIVIEGDQIKILERGKTKFIDEVAEVTFNGQEALKRGKEVYFATNVGTFHLTERGMELNNVMPGIDVQKDLLDESTMDIVLPPSGQVPVVPSAIVTGEGFRLDF